MSKKIGSQIRETLEEAGMKVIEKNGKDIILSDESGKRELWTMNDHFSGYVIEYRGKGYEFVRTIRVGSGS